MCVCVIDFLAFENNYGTRNIDDWRRKKWIERGKINAFLLGSQKYGFDVQS